MIKVVTVKFKDGGKPYYFAPGKEPCEVGAGVIVETAKGLEYAKVVSPETEVEDDKVVAPLKPVVRVATARDEEVVRRNAERRGEAMQTAREKIAARGLEMKLVDCEFAFDGSKVVFLFTAESRVDFRELIKDLSSAFHMRIELRQINIRDEIKLTGGLGCCGRECCCIRSISEPLKVSVKMAKNQGLSLNPSKISGLCGRLMCCLAYENEYYSEVCKQVPKVGSTVETPNGEGMVVNVNMLKMAVKVKIENGDAISYHDFGVDEIRFMRGNVVMGRENFDEPEPAEIAADGESAAAEKTAGENNGERAGRTSSDGRGDRQNGKNRRDNRDNRENRDRRRDGRGDRPDRAKGDRSDQNRGDGRDKNNRGHGKRDNRGERTEGAREPQRENRQESRANNTPEDKNRNDFRGDRRKKRRGNGGRNQSGGQGGGATSANGENRGGTDGQ